MKSRRYDYNAAVDAVATIATPSAISESNRIRIRYDYYDYTTISVTFIKSRRIIRTTEMRQATVDLNRNDFSIFQVGHITIVVFNLNMKLNLE